MPKDEKKVQYLKVGIMFASLIYIFIKIEMVILILKSILEVLKN